MLAFVEELLEELELVTLVFPKKHYAMIHIISQNLNRQRNCLSISKIPIVTLANHLKPVLYVDQNPLFSKILMDENAVNGSHNLRKNLRHL